MPEVAVLSSPRIRRVGMKRDIRQVEVGELRSHSVVVVVVVVDWADIVVLGYPSQDSNCLSEEEARATTDRAILWAGEPLDMIRGACLSEGMVLGP